MIECRCREVGHLHGRAAQQYARSHLEELKVDAVSWAVLYRCPLTGLLWKEFFPRSGAHGGGPSELVRIDQAQAAAEFGSPANGFGGDLGPAGLR